MKMPGERKGLFLVPIEMTFYPTGDEKIPGGPEMWPYTCGRCGRDTPGRVLVKREEGPNWSRWCLCSHPDCGAPTVITVTGGECEQWPPEVFQVRHAKIPEKMRKLFLEASSANGMGAHTACVLVCRRMLIDIADSLGCDFDRSKHNHFQQAEKYICEEVLGKAMREQAEKRIGAMRQIGNDATHRMKMMGREEAEDSLRTIADILITAYPFSSEDGEQ